MSTPPFSQLAFWPAFLQNFGGSESRRTVSSSSSSATAAPTRAHHATISSRCSNHLVVLGRRRRRRTSQSSATRSISADEIDLGRVGFVAGHALVDEVPVGVELRRHVATAARSSRRLRATSSSAAFDGRVFQQPVDEASPPLVEIDLGAISSSTSTPGGSPASIGCSVRSRCANACSVEIAAESTSSSASAAPLPELLRPSSGSAAASSSSLRIRSRSSAAAFSVKVIAAMWRIGTRTVSSSAVISATTRSTSDFVLPDPAPASANSVSASSVPIASRAARRRR